MSVFHTLSNQTPERPQSETLQATDNLQPANHRHMELTARSYCRVDFGQHVQEQAGRSLERCGH